VCFLAACSGVQSGQTFSNPRLKKWRSFPSWGVWHGGEADAYSNWQGPDHRACDGVPVWRHRQGVDRALGGIGAYGGLTIELMLVLCCVHLFLFPATITRPRSRNAGPASDGPSDNRASGGKQRPTHGLSPQLGRAPWPPRHSSTIRK
jgi:hypothetical protein